MLPSLLRMIQRNVTELSPLGERERADIGLDRSGILRVAAGNSNSSSPFRLNRRDNPTPSGRGA